MKDTKKQYSAPEVEVIQFEGEDIITEASGQHSVGHSTLMPTIY